MRQNLIILFVLISTFALGQNHFLGFQTGLNLSNVTPKEKLENSNMRIGFIGGITYDLKFSNRFQIGIDALYSQQGFKNNMIYVDGENIYVLEENYKAKYDYLSFPIKFGYEMGNKIKIIPKIGIIPAFSVKAKHTYPEFNDNREVIGHESTNFKDYVSKFDFGGLIEVGIENGLSDKIILCSSLSFKHSLTTFLNSDYLDRYDDPAMKHYGFSLSIGLKYGL